MESGVGKEVGRRRGTMLRQTVVTSWPISGFWVLLSLLLSLLATYSFLQADWVIKRNLIITKFYETGSPVNLTSTPGGGYSAESGNQTVVGPRKEDGYFEDLPELFERQEVSPQNHERMLRRIVRVSRVVTTTRFGTLGVCTSLLSNGIFTCHLYDRERGAYAVSALWPVRNFRPFLFSASTGLDILISLIRQCLRQSRLT
jgi:hypothetical protein